MIFSHVYSSHKDFIVRSILLDGDVSSLASSASASGSSKRYLECRFCGQHFMRRHVKLFTFHVEQKHEADLQKFLNRQPVLNVDDDEGKQASRPILVRDLRLDLKFFAIDAVKSEAPPGGLHTGTSNVCINFYLIAAARWRLPVNSAYICFQTAL